MSKTPTNVVPTEPPPPPPTRLRAGRVVAWLAVALAILGGVAYGWLRLTAGR